jgi:hypothetical protein
MSAFWIVRILGCRDFELSGFWIVKILLSVLCQSCKWLIGYLLTHNTVYKCYKNLFYLLFQLVSWKKKFILFGHVMPISSNHNHRKINFFPEQKIYQISQSVFRDWLKFFFQNKFFSWATGSNFDNLWETKNFICLAL